MLFLNLFNVVTKYGCNMDNVDTQLMSECRVDYFLIDIGQQDK
jgi:hypothetical protein